MLKRFRKVSEEVSGNSFILPAELDDDKSISIMGRRANIICILVAAALLWSIFAPIDELVLANGEIIPTDQVTSVEHREGGIVDEIAVKEGQHVRAGEIILELNTISTEADFNQVQIQALSLELKLISLNALINNTEPDFKKAGTLHPDLVAKQLVTHNARKALVEKELAGLRTNLALRELEVFSIEKEIQSFNRQAEIEQERYDSLRELLQAGHVSRQEFLDAKAALERVIQNIDGSEGRRSVAQLQIIEAQRTIESKFAQDKKLFVEEQSELASEFSQISEQLNKQQDRAERLQIRSPIDGVVQELSPKTIGEVVGSGELIARIVPADSKIVAEVRVDPYDIGHIKAGDVAEVNVSTFDPSIFGVAEGQIAVLSPTTFLTDQGDPYYKAVISLNDNFVGSDGKKRFLQAGMIVDAKIKTGSKSLMRYILKPVMKSFGTSFSER